MPAWLVLGTAFLFGANVGSFLNVVAHRLPLQLSVVKPRSRCPACRSPIAALDNIPILSWCLLRGRCRGCKAGISPRYAIVELLTGLLALHSAWVLVWQPGAVGDPMAWAHWGVVLVLLSALMAASLIDLDLTILPDEITVNGLYLAPVACAFVPALVLGPDRADVDWVPAELPVALRAVAVSLAGMAVGAGVIAAVGWLGKRYYKREAMGFGDVKLLGMIGGLTGPVGALVTLVLASFIGSAFGLPRYLTKGRLYIPFGPFLAAGGYLYVVYGPRTYEWYLEFARGGV